MLPPAPTESVGASPSPTTSVSVPPEATAPTPQGASAFGRHYFAVLSKGFQEADSDALAALSDTGCGGCQNFIQAIQGSADADEVTRGGEFSVLFAESPPIINGEVVIDVRYERSKAEVIADDGAVVAVVPADPPLDAQMRLQWQSNQWLVLGLRANPT